MILALASMLFSWMLAIPIGIVVAVKQNSISDRVLSFLAFFGMSVPNFFLAFLMMYLALRTGWFPVGGTFLARLRRASTPGASVADRINHLILPVFVLGSGGMASLMRLMRSQILEIKNADFVRTARAKGLSGAGRDVQARAAQRPQSRSSRSPATASPICSAARRWSRR